MNLIGPIKNPRYKTTICEKWVNFGNCSYDYKCQFAHGYEELEYWRNKTFNDLVTTNHRNNDITGRNNDITGRINDITGRNNDDKNEKEKENKMTKNLSNEDLTEILSKDVFVKNLLKKRKKKHKMTPILKPVCEKNEYLKNLEPFYLEPNNFENRKIKKPRSLSLGNMPNYNSNNLESTVLNFLKKSKPFLKSEYEKIYEKAVFHHEKSQELFNLCFKMLKNS